MTKKIFVRLFSISIIISFTSFIGLNLFKVNFKAEPVSTNIISTPLVANISGENQGNNKQILLSFDLTQIDAKAVLSNVFLSYTQSGKSSDFIKIINKADNTIIDSKSLIYEGSQTINISAAIIQKWITEPTSNLGILFVSNEIKPDESIDFSNIVLSFEYEIPDNTPPVISDVAINNITLTSADITFKTNEEANGYINYGKTSAYDNKISLTEYALDHKITLDKLLDGITYHFQIIVLDRTGNKTVSEDNKFITSINKGSVLGTDYAIVDEEQLKVPSNLDLQLKTNSGGYFVNIGWNASTTDNITGYIIYRSVDNRNDFEQYKIVDKSTVKISDFEVESLHTYFYFVRTYKDNKISNKTKENAIYIPEPVKGTVLGADSSQPFSMNVMLAIFAALGLIIFVYFVFYKIFTNLAHKLQQSSAKKTHYKNLFRDPDFFS